METEKEKKEEIKKEIFSRVWKKFCEQRREEEAKEQKERIEKLEKEGE